MGWVADATPEVQAQSKCVTILAVCICLSVLSTATVCCRLWLRSKSRGLAADDYMSVLSMIFALAYSILCIAQTKYGLGLPVQLRPVASESTYAKVNLAGRPVYQIGISFFKIALLISYLRLLQGTSRDVYRTLIWSTIIVVFLAHAGCALSIIFACSPVRKSWEPGVPGTCLRPGPSFTGYAVVTIVSDIVVAILPIPIFSRLDMRPERKLGLVGIFMLGLFTTICSVLRYLQIDRIQNGDGNSAMLILWGTIEFNVGNIMSCLPFITPVCISQMRSHRAKVSENDESHGLRDQTGSTHDQTRPGIHDFRQDGTVSKPECNFSSGQGIREKGCTSVLHPAPRLVSASGWR